MVRRPVNTGKFGVCWQRPARLQSSAPVHTHKAAFQPLPLNRGSRLIPRQLGRSALSPRMAAVR